jgi:hypothetical protein
MHADRYRKRPVIIEAVRYDPLNQERAVEFLRAGGANFVTALGFRILTLEGEMTVSPGDWIIKGVQGEFYPCKPDIFDATYEPA